jgi:hypothetical protein
MQVSANRMRTRRTEGHVLGLAPRYDLRGLAPGQISGREMT